MGKVDVVEELAEVLGCKMGCLSITYLRLPLSSSFKAHMVCNSVMRMERTLAS
jgi:hypothetical protein